MDQRGLAPIVILLIAAGVLVIGAGVYFYSHQNHTAPNSPAIQNSSSSISILTPAATSSNEAAQVQTSSYQSYPTSTHTCANLPALIEATSSQQEFIDLPENNYVKVHVDQFSMANVDPYGAGSAPGCKKVAILFATTAQIGRAYISITTGDKEVGRIEVAITNHPDFQNLPALKDVDPAARSALMPLLQRFWQPFFVKKADFNQDNADDYVIAMEQPSDTFEVNDSFEEGKRDRKMVILMSDVGGKYFVSEDIDGLLACGTCGGASFFYPDTSISVQGDEIKMSDYGGTAWRWDYLTILKYDLASKQWKIVFTSDDSFSVNADFWRTRDYTESTYNTPIDSYLAGNKTPLSTRRFEGPESLEAQLPETPIPYKQLALDNFHAFPEFYASTTYDGDVYYLVPYYFDHDFRSVSSTEKEGAYLVHDDKVAWETPNPINFIDLNKSHFEDVNGDGVAEIIIVDNEPHFVSESYVCNYYIYSWNNGDPKLLPANKVQLSGDEQDDTNHGCNIVGP